jgi:hypothetical protein
VVLSPGDVLYLPPFWFHRVIAETMSISVNEWSDSEELSVFYDEIMVAPVPLEEDYSLDQKFISLQQFFQQILVQLKEDPSELMNELKQQRYIPLFGPIDLQTVHNPCTSSGAVWADFKASIAANIAAKSKNYAHLFTKIASYSEDNSIRNILLFQYFEQAVSSFLGVESVNEFFQTCF